MNLLTLTRGARALLFVASAAAIAGMLGIGLVRAQDAGSATRCTLSVDPLTVASGESVTLSWTTENADTFTVDQGVGTLTPTAGGATTLTPSASLTYTGEASGPYGTSTCSTTIGVVAPTSSEPTDPADTTDTTDATDTSTTDTSEPTPQTSSTSSGAMQQSLDQMMQQLQQTAQTAQTVAPSTVVPSVPSTPVMPTTVSAPVTAALSYPAAGSTPAPMVAEIAADGTVLLRGTVQAVGANELSVSSWGGTWTVRTGAGTVIPAGTAAGSVDAIAVGDFVGVSGTAAADQAFTIDATLVRDWTTDPYVEPAATSTDAMSEPPTDDTTVAPDTEIPVDSADSAEPSAEDSTYTEPTEPTEEPVAPDESQF